MADEDFSHLSNLELLKQFLYEIAKYEESLKLEIFALRKTLEAYANPKSPSDPPLEETVTALMNDGIVKHLVHAEFEPILRQIDDLIEGGKLTELLSSWTPKGPIH